MFGVYQHPQSLFSPAPLDPSRWQLCVYICVGPHRRDSPLSSLAQTIALTTQASSKHRLAVTTDHQWHLERNGCSYNITVDLGKILGSKRIALSFIATLSPSFSLIHPLSYPNLAWSQPLLFPLHILQPWLLSTSNMLRFTSNTWLSKKTLLILT